MKNKKLVLSAVLVLILVFGCLAAVKAYGFVMDKYHFLRDTLALIDARTNKVQQYDLDYSWVKDNVLVAHAFGGKGSKTYTNSLEAFEYNYGLGHRIFEVDFDLSEDLVTICSHDEDYWRYMSHHEDDGMEYSYENFKNSPLFDDYTPLDHKDIIDLLCKYPDIYIITDTKHSDKIKVYQQFSQIVDAAKKADPSVLDRIIPQIYTKEMLDYVMDVHPFKSVIFTLYQIQWEAEDIASFCVESGVRYLTISQDMLDEESAKLFESMRILTAVHTLDDEKEARAFLDQGVDMIYTNFLLPEQFETEENND